MNTILYLHFYLEFIFLLGHKRRASFEDEEMSNDDNHVEVKPSFSILQPKEEYTPHTPKRNRLSLKKEFPISKLLGNNKN